jgi:3-phosphoshikimate 1-carboxyvinyltransferase
VKLKIHSGNPLKGEITVGNGIGIPGDKSLSHRAALFAAMAQGESVINNLLVSGVTTAMLNCLTKLGVIWELDGNCLQVQGRGISGLSSPNDRLDCGNSATTMRLLTGAVALAGIPVTLDGSGGLRRRPMGRIVDPLRTMGVPIIASPGGKAPLTLQARDHSRRLIARTHRLPVASAQVKSCILLASLAAEGESRVIEPGPSRDHTERMLSSMGIEISSKQHLDTQTGEKMYSTIISPPTSLSFPPLRLTLPGDISSAAFLITAAVTVPDSHLLLRGIGLNPTRTGLLDALISMGADIQVTGKHLSAGEPVGDLEIKYSPLKAINVSGELVVRMIDEFPAFAVAAASAQGKTVVTEAEELRKKESDRITMLCKNLDSLGVSIIEKEDGFQINGGNQVSGGNAQPFGDHRLAMSMAVAGMAAEGDVIIQDAEMINESFPQFIDVFRGLGVDLSLED